MKSQCCKNMGPPTYLWDLKQLDEEINQENVLTVTKMGEPGLGVCSPRRSERCPSLILAALGHR
jgi:hypothetical protein